MTTHNVTLARGATLEEIISRVKAEHDLRTARAKVRAAAPRFVLTSAGPSAFQGTETTHILNGKPTDIQFKAGYRLFLIREAWNRGEDFEDLADGYGLGQGTHGDWSGIRDSSPEAVTKMLERALNFLFPETG